MQIKYFQTLLLCFTIVNTLAQNVGIGTATPSEKLEVTGNIKSDTVKSNVVKITSNAASGKVLTSDNSGNGSWQNISQPNGSVGFGSWGTNCSTPNISEYNPAISPNGNFANGDVDISGNFAIFGTGSGKAEIFQFNGTNWVFYQSLLPQANTYNPVNFGTVVSISNDYAIVGYSTDTVGSTSNGKVYVYKNINGNWQFYQVLKDPNGLSGDRFGEAISIENNRIIVGAPSDDISFADQGSAVVFIISGSQFVYFEKLYDTQGKAGDYFGASVGISKDPTPFSTAFNVIVGVPGHDEFVGHPNGGKVLFYRYASFNWQLLGTRGGAFVSPIAGNNFNDRVGHVVSISGNYAIASAPGYSHLYSYGIGWKNDIGKITAYKLSSTGITDIGEFYDSTYYRLGENCFFNNDHLIYTAQDRVILPNGTETNLENFIFIHERIGDGMWRLIQQFTNPIKPTALRIEVTIDGFNKRFAISPIDAVNRCAAFGKVNQ